MANERTFCASRDKALFVVVGSVAAVAIGYFIRLERPLVAWACIIFFGCCSVVGLILMVSPKSICLRLDSEGFEMSSFIRTTRIKWSDVERFELGSVRRAKMIRIVYAPHYKEHHIVRGMARLLSGMESAILNSYDAPLTEVLAALNEWRTRYG